MKGHMSFTQLYNTIQYNSIQYELNRLVYKNVIFKKFTHFAKFFISNPKSRI
jgi:hypothetical protein